MAGKEECRSMNQIHQGPAPIDFFAPLFEKIRYFSGLAIRKFLTAPVRNTVIGLVTLAIAHSAGNALFWQPHAHPSPFFATPSRSLSVEQTGSVVSPGVAPHPLELAVRRAGTLQTPPVQTVTAPRAAPADIQGKVTNQMLADAQRNLKEMRLFDGKIDGFYGPQTAAAIRAFETRVGLPPKGAMTFALISMINSSVTPAFRPTTVPEPQPQPQPVQRIATDNVSADTGTQQDKLQEIVAGSASRNDTVKPSRVASVVEQGQRPNTASNPAFVSPPVATSTSPSTDQHLVEQVQRGLASLGFYNRAIDGVAGQSTARAIREFENFKSFRLTGEVSPDLLVWLKEAGAQI